MITLTLTFPTLEDAQDAVNKLSGVTVSAGVTSDAAAPAAPAKKPTNKDKGKAATAAGVAKKADAPVPDVGALKTHIMAHAGDNENAADNVKAFVKTFGVAKLSEMSDAQRADAHAKAPAYFAALNSAGDDEGEEDPMA